MSSAGRSAPVPSSAAQPQKIDLVFPRFKLLSGAERAILGLARALAGAGHRVRIVCHQFDDSCRPRLSADVDLVCTNLGLNWSGNRYLNAVSDYARCFRLGPHLDRQADVLVFFGPALPLVWYLRAVRRSSASVLYYCWEPPRALYQDRGFVVARLGRLRHIMAPLLRLYAAVDRHLIRLAGAVCTSSRFAADRIEAVYGLSASVITLGVDRSRLDAVRSLAPELPPMVLTVNYLHPRKRIDLIIQAAALCGTRWEDEMQRPRWVIVGDGPERDNLQTLVDQLELGAWVRFAGFVSDDELPQYYAAATCYVHAGLDESFGLSVIEAAYCGCPVVAVDEGGVQDIVDHGVTGYRVPATASELARAVEAVLGREDRGRALGRAGHQRIASTYRWDQGAIDLVRLAGTVKG